MGCAVWYNPFLMYLMGMSWFLEGKLKDNSPWYIPIHDGGFTIGRSSGSTLILTAGSVSRTHSSISFTGEDPYITDLNSRNGTFLNGCRVHGKTRLKEDDIICFGTVEFVLRYQVEDEEEEKTIIDDGIAGKKSFSEIYGISEREEEVLFLLLKGLNIKDIGEKLFISPGTVKNHVLKIYSKTGVHSRIELSNLYQDTTE